MINDLKKCTFDLPNIFSRYKKSQQMSRHHDFPVFFSMKMIITTDREPYHNLNID